MGKEHLSRNGSVEFFRPELAMEKRHVAGIDFAFDVLEIIAVLKSLVYVDVILWNQRPLKLRQFGMISCGPIYAQITPPASRVG